MARFTFDRDFYIPKGSRKTTCKAGDAVAYVYEFTGYHGQRFGAMVFFGKQAKPASNYTYKTASDREASVTRSFEAAKAIADHKQANRAKKRAYVNDWKVGDIVNTHWGYDETHREYYEVVASSGMTVTLRQVGCEAYDLGYDYRSEAAPLAGHYIGEAFKVRAQEGSLKVEGRYAGRTSFTTVAGVKVYQSAMVGGCH